MFYVRLGNIILDVSRLTNAESEEKPNNIAVEKVENISYTMNGFAIPFPKHFDYMPR